MSLVKCWYHYFFDRQASNNFAAYLFLSYIGSILATSWFQAGCHPRRPAPRVDRTKQHLLKDILVITILAMIAGAGGVGRHRKLWTQQAAMVRRIFRVTQWHPSAMIHFVGCLKS
jgi:hypothetical protein